MTFRVPDGAYRNVLDMLTPRAPIRGPRGRGDTVGTSVLEFLADAASPS